MRCTACGHENRSGRKFCSECGAPLAVVCASCGVPNEPGERFCGECGAALEGAAAEPAAVAVVAVPSVERRLVSILFADLVGFTPLSESRDAEEVRELLSDYFETARTVIGRYGGNVEKFIGDAVMAVWGRRHRRTTPSGRCGPDSSSSMQSPRWAGGWLHGQVSSRARQR